MTLKLNVSDFRKFIEMHGQVSYDDAKKYSDIGHEIIKIAMASVNPQRFEEEMTKLQEQQKDILADGTHSISNMASCLLYAQTYDNFSLHQGYGKGANINQYGDPETSHRAIANLMVYFSTSREGKEYGYDGGSTHGKWRDSKQELPPEIPNMKLRIDIDPDPNNGSIPAPLKGIHTAHLVPGVDSNGVVKLLVKPENWGMKKLLHIIFHSIDFIVTRLFDSKVEGLESRQENKILQEASVRQVAQELTQLAKDISKLSEPSLKALFNDINKELSLITKMRGFDEPVTHLKTVAEKINNWVTNNPEHTQHQELSDYAEFMQSQINSLSLFKENKYGAPEQLFSEVRLNYKENGVACASSQKFNEYKSHYKQSHNQSDDLAVKEGERSTPPSPGQ